MRLNSGSEGLIHPSTPHTLMTLKVLFICQSSMSRPSDKQGWVENSTPGIYQWNLLVFPCMANKAQVADTGK